MNSRDAVAAAQRTVAHSQSLRRQQQMIVMRLGPAYRGQSHPNAPAVRSAYINPSTVDLIVVLQERRYQIDICQSATEYPRNALAPASWKTRRYGAPTGSARPTTYAAKRLTMTE